MKLLINFLGFLQSLVITIAIHGHYVKRNMAYVWEVPYVPLAYIGIGCLIGSYLL